MAGKPTEILTDRIKEHMEKVGGEMQMLWKGSVGTGKNAVAIPHLELPEGTRHQNYWLIDAKYTNLDHYSPK